MKLAFEFSKSEKKPETGVCEKICLYKYDNMFGWSLNSSCEKVKENHVLM